MIKTFSSRAGRLSPTNKDFLNIESECLLKLGQQPETSKPIVIDIGFGDAQSFSKDVVANNGFCFIGIEPYKKGFARAIEFYERNKPDNLYLHNGDAREYLESISFEFSFVRIHFPDPWPKKRHVKRRLINHEFLKFIHTKIAPKGKLEIITDSEVYQNHIKEILDKQSLFEAIDEFEITYEISTFHKKGLDKKHAIERYVLLKN